MSQPSVATIKRLFAVSGNKCAFPNCENSLVDVNSGKVIGRICHIRAKNVGGPRYDPDQSEKERNSFQNLILMCPIHHDVIDDDLESYTVKRLEEIKSHHESMSTKDLELDDSIARQFISTIDTNLGIVLYAKDAGEVNWDGDYFPGGNKYVISHPTAQEDTDSIKLSTIEKLIDNIQSVLYVDNSRLPYALSLCVDLCNRVGLSNRYGLWLWRELNGYRDLQIFRDEFGDEHEFDEWMDEWASYRMVRPYIQAINFKPENRQYQRSTFPINETFITFTIEELVRIIEDTKKSDLQHYSIPLRNLGEYQ